MFYHRRNSRPAPPFTPGIIKGTMSVRHVARLKLSRRRGVQIDEPPPRCAWWVWGPIVMTLLIHKRFQHCVRANSASGAALNTSDTASHYSFSSFFSSSTSSPYLRPISLFLRNMINVHLATGGFSNCQHTSPVRAVHTHMHTHTRMHVHRGSSVQKRKCTQKKRYAKTQKNKG